MLKEKIEEIIRSTWGQLSLVDDKRATHQILSTIQGEVEKLYKSSINMPTGRDLERWNDYNEGLKDVSILLSEEPNEK